MEPAAEPSPPLPSMYPVPNPSPSFWLRDAALQDTRTTAALPASADFVVVGSGLTGTAAARRLAQLGKSVVVLEARGVASGATGRNGGHLYEAASDDWLGLVETVGGDEAEAKALIQFQDDTIQAMIDVVAELQLSEAELFRGDPSTEPTVAGGKGAILFLTEEHREKIRARIAARTAAGALRADQFGEIGAEEAREQFNAPTAVGAMLTTAGSVWAAKLTIGMMNDAISKGVNLQCQTLVHSIAKQEEEGDDVHDHPISVVTGQHFSSIL
jgi:glycine/D-amino acid oxidase-like deaminating enzyme